MLYQCIVSNNDRNRRYGISNCAGFEAYQEWIIIFFNIRWSSVYCMLFYTWIYWHQQVVINSMVPFTIPDMHCKVCCIERTMNVNDFHVSSNNETDMGTIHVGIIRTALINMFSPKNLGDNNNQMLRKMMGFDWDIFHCLIETHYSQLRYFWG